MARPVLIAPSVLSADFGHLQRELDSVATADWIQVDVMDGHFVPNLSFGAPVIKHMKTSLLLDAHLMVANPAERFEEMIKAGCKNVTFHIEAVEGAQAQSALCRDIRGSGATCGVALKLATPVSALTPLLKDIDLALIMSIEPGFAGQEFQMQALEKIRELRALAPDLMIQVDGGINAETARLCRDAGADNLVAATAIFGKKDRAKAIADLRGA